VVKLDTTTHFKNMKINIEKLVVIGQDNYGHNILITKPLKVPKRFLDTLHSIFITDDSSDYGSCDSICDIGKELSLKKLLKINPYKKFTKETQRRLKGIG
jgi:hypothetical protein